MSDLYIQSNASSGASGAGAATSFSSSASASAGSNALTTSVQYTPSSAVLTAPATRLAADSAAGGSSPNGGPSPAPRPTRPPSRRRQRHSARRLYAAIATTEALSINHQGQFPSVTVSFNLAPNASLGTAITDIEKWHDRLNFPPSLQADFQGTAASFQNSLSNEALLILAALVTVYIVLGVLYESFIHPDHDSLHAALGRSWRAARTHHLPPGSLSVVAIIGIILLIGIVKKNGIMIVDFALEAERERGQVFDRGHLSKPACCAFGPS